MKLKFIAALVALGIWTQPARASSIEYIIDQTTSNFWLTGDNPSPSQGDLLLGRVSVGFEPFDAYNPVEAWWQVYASVSGLPPSSDFYSQINAQNNNGYAESGCRYEICTDDVGFDIPSGLLNIELTVNVHFTVACFDEIAGADYCESPGVISIRTPTYELTLSVPDNLNLGLFPPTPLPAALPLFAAGLGVIGWFGRRRRRKA
jgi:hypothetical protein